MTIGTRNDSGAQAGRTLLSAGRAAGELGLGTGELELAIDLGRIRAEPWTSGRPKVARAEVARVRADPDFPDGLREGIRTVGTAEGADAMGVTPARFAKLARLGCLEPVSFYCNRYGAVVWLYLARELEAFAAEHPELLTGRLPTPMREKLDTGHDGRPRSWRQRRAGQLLNRSDDPWHTAAVMAAMLDAEALALVARDPIDRKRLRELRPRLVPGRSETSTGDTARRLFLAEDREELLWARTVIGLRLQVLREAEAAALPESPPAPVDAGDGPAGAHREQLGRETSEAPPAPRPEAAPPLSAPEPVPAGAARMPAPARSSSGLLGLLRRARRQPLVGRYAPPGPPRSIGRKSPSCTTETRSRPSRS
ncbi:DUF6397 family protein [Streptomyces sp. NPDC060194]|uniref:DUF6397 family protein n=1 Tax=Streptomyces sp. NPDC060194 TaxID=3347069 RepID=UPI00365841A2